MLLPNEIRQSLSPALLQSLSEDELTTLFRNLTELEKIEAETRLYQLFPDTGRLRRELYPKHLQFFAAGAQHQERCMLAANRVGKTFGAGGYETALHLTGDYPDWWQMTTDGLMALHVHAAVGHECDR
jgi:hypothetical protein